MQTSMWRSIDSQERERQSQPRLAKHLLVAKGLIRLLRNVSGAPTGHAVVMLQSDGQNSIIIVGGANMSCWPDAMCNEDLEVVRNAGIVLLQREIADFVNIQVAKGTAEAAPISLKSK
ncbi:Ribokinase [Camellia lanceoleosa]|uniref:Ribokinase n=1 Tax=Camellia lanceoleosa TaxID=1840588 RepID=A0ACC0HFY8_9ERIC|nr:Ribokinase [Camellia lanceoleosa]